jgi:sugar lactone lactonase YvrE
MARKAEPIRAYKSKHGEGPFWYAPGNVLYWVDIDAGRVCIYAPTTDVNRTIDVHEPCGTVVPRRSGGVMVALESSFAHVDLATGAVRNVAKVENPPPKKRFNDGKCDPAGRFWAGTMAYDQTKGAASLYRLDPDLSVRSMVRDVTISNGIVWTRDARTMYYIDTPTHEVWAYDYDDQTGEIRNRRTVIRVPKEMGHPDGMCIDSQDCVWIALWDGARACRWDPRSGRLLDTVEVEGAKQTSACALGGENLDELYITTSTQGFTPEKHREQPNAGYLFRCKVDVPGVIGSEFAG